MAIAEYGQARAGVLNARAAQIYGNNYMMDIKKMHEECEKH